MNGTADEEFAVVVKHQIDAFADRLLAGLERHVGIVDVEVMRHAIIVHHADGGAGGDCQMVRCEVPIILADEDSFGGQRDRRRNSQGQQKPDCAGQACLPIVRLFRDTT